MILALDAGNTHIVIGIFSGETLIFKCRISTDTTATEDEYAATIFNLFHREKINAKDIKEIIVSSVVPSLTYIFNKFSLKYMDKNALIIGPGIKTGLSVKFENPKEIGADRIANSVAAINLYGSPAIIVDFGTATTFDIINAQQEYIGGIIAPGILMSIQLLHTKTAKLPEVEVEQCSYVVGKNTTQSIKSGIFHGYLSMIDGIIEKILKEQEFATENTFTISTGGLGNLFMENSRYLKCYAPHLTLDGLRIIYEKNI